MPGLGRGSGKTAFVVALVAGCVTACPAAAATYYVGGTGAADANAGTAAQPWATVTRALSAPDGSLVLVKPGRYPALAPAPGADLSHTAGAVTIRRSDYSPTDDPRTLAAARKVSIGDPATSRTDLPALYGITFEGLQFNSSMTFNGADRLNIRRSEIGPVPEKALLFQKHSSSTYSLRNSSLDGNWFHDSNEAQKQAGVQNTGGIMIGILAATASNQGNENIEISGNQMDRIVGGDGIQISGARNVVIEGNRILSGSSGENNDHVDALQVLAPVTDLTVRRNFVGDQIRGFLLQQKATKVCVATGLPGCSTGVENVDWVFSDYYSGPLGRINIENNVLTGPDFSLRLLGAFDSRVVNNTFWGTGYGQQGFGVGLQATRTDDPVQAERLVFANNIMRNLFVDGGIDFARRGGNLAVYQYGEPALGETYGLLATPAFVDPLSNWELAASDTVARDQGLADLAPATDFRGWARDARPDIGAYEYGAIPPVPPPPADTSPPTAPAGLVATALSATSVRLAWTASTDNKAVAGYRIYRNGSATPVATVAPSTTYTDAAVAPSTAYVYTVAAFDAAGNQSAQSVQAKAATPALTANLVVTALGNKPGTTTYTVKLAKVKITLLPKVAGVRCVSPSAQLTPSSGAVIFKGCPLDANGTRAYVVSAVPPAGYKLTPAGTRPITLTSAGPSTMTLTFRR